MKIYIVRHGETAANAEGRIQGWSDDPLNGMGIRLAEETGRALRGVRFDCAYTSPLIRAAKTAEILLRESGNSCPVMTDERIKEIHMGDWEGKHFRPENCEIDPELLRSFFSDPMALPAFPNGENVRDVMKRTQAFLREIAEGEEKTVLVTTHGAALRAMLHPLYDDPADFWHGHVPYNCAVNIVEAEGSTLRLIADDRILYDPALCVERFRV